jgi:lysozyme family protein
MTGMFGFGFGLDVPMMKFGTMSTIGAPAASNEGTCSDPFALQQMLKDLGYYGGAIDGAIGSGTMTALRKFAEETGAPYTKGTFPKAATCQAVMDAWAAKMAPAQVPAPSPTAQASGSGPGHFLLSPTLMQSLFKKTSTPTSGSAAPGSSWWGSQTTVTKVAVVGGALVVVGGVAYLVLGKKRATPNRRRRRRH